YYVHPVDIQEACLIIEGAEFTKNIINFFLYQFNPPEFFPSFPTRRSSDLHGIPQCYPCLRSTCHPCLQSLQGATAPTSDQMSLRSEEHTSELQSPYDLVCRLLLEKKKTLLISSSIRLKPLNCSRLSCVYDQ